eukprot:Phypoly_transcript_10143.p1 GENE.Phypoly_transcript_10143~~Phypoly_transcript_10143.p1  ORF type:complete len:353 (+),score=-9.80 Phypoly_transcript_10143:109-1167(+)
MNPHPYNEYQQHVYWASILIVTTCCVLASVLIILSYFLFPKSRNVHNRIIVCLSISDLGTALCGPVCAFYLFHTNLDLIPDSSALCIFQATLVEYFALVSMCWLGVIAFNNYFLLVHRKVISTRMEISFHVVCWSVPLIPTLLAIFKNWFGSYDKLWCSYAQNRQLELLINMGGVAVPVLGIIAYSYLSIMSTMRRSRRSLELQKSFYSATSLDKDMRVITRMTWFIVMYGLTWFPFMGLFLINYIRKSFSPYQLQVAVQMLAHSQGLSNFFLYFFNKQFKNLAREVIVTQFPSLRKKLYNENSLTSSSSTPTRGTGPAGASGSTANRTSMPKISPESILISSKILDPQHLC